MKKQLAGLLVLFLALNAPAQNIQITKNGKISFYSRAKSPEKVEADNNEVSSVFNTETGDIVFAVLMKSFHFERALMAIPQKARSIPAVNPRPRVLPVKKPGT